MRDRLGPIGIPVLGVCDAEKFKKNNIFKKQPTFSGSLERLDMPSVPIGPSIVTSERSGQLTSIVPIVVVSLQPIVGDCSRLFVADCWRLFRLLLSHF